MQTVWVFTRLSQRRYGITLIAACLWGKKGRLLPMKSMPSPPSCYTRMTSSKKMRSWTPAVCLRSKCRIAMALRFLRSGSMGNPGFRVTPDVKLGPLSQCEGVQCGPALNAHVLFSVDHIRHRAGGNGRPEVCLPQQFAVTGIQRHELSIASSGE